MKNRFLILFVNIFFQLISKAGFGQQNKLGGTYITDISDFSGGRSYFTSITYKYRKDTFFYWHGTEYGETTGTGVYKIDGNKLYLIFENNKEQKSSKRLWTLTPVFGRPVPDNYELSFNAIDDQGKEEYGSSLIIKTASGLNDTLSIVNTPLIKAYKNRDFPLQVKGILISHKPVNFEIDTPGCYNVNINFQQLGNEKICNGEIWMYNIIELKQDKMILQEIKGSDETKKSQEFIFISYKKGYSQ